MRKSRFSDEQIIGIIKEYEAGAKLTELCQRQRWPATETVFCSLQPSSETDKGHSAFRKAATVSKLRLETNVSHRPMSDEF